VGGFGDWERMEDDNNLASLSSPERNVLEKYRTLVSALQAAQAELEQFNMTNPITYGVAIGTVELLSTNEAILLNIIRHGGTFNIVPSESEVIKTTEYESERGLQLGYSYMERLVLIESEEDMTNEPDLSKLFRLITEELSNTQRTMHAENERIIAESIASRQRAAEGIQAFEATVAGAREGMRLAAKTMHDARRTLEAETKAAPMR
jgi:hypothetical protein